MLKRTIEEQRHERGCNSLIDPLADANRRRGINSVETGIRVLESLIEIGGPASLKSVADRTGLQPSQAHRYIASLVNSGIMRQDSATGLYDLGPTALRLGLHAIATHDALNDVEALAKTISETEFLPTNVLVWGTGGPTVIRFFRGKPPLYSQVGMGTTFPVTGSVAGRVFMSYLREEELAPHLASEGLPIPLESHSQQMSDIRRIRARGGELGDSQQIPGLRACAAPVFVLGNVLVAVVAVPIPQTHSLDRLESVFELLVAHCKEATYRLGGRWPIAAEPEIE